MSARAIREVLIAGLEAGAVPGVNRIAVREAFLSGVDDLSFAEYPLDSLAQVELCIAIEAGLRVVLSPEDLRAYPSAGDLARALEGGGFA
ncbi:MAG: acyl carrier protein [Burkholderiales bacterium]